MTAFRGVMLVVGALALLMGLLWIGQGLGYVHWPAKGNFMLDDRAWAFRGAVLALAGLALIVVNRPRGIR